MNLLEYIGKFHPLAVHLPIGTVSIFLVMAVFISRTTLKNSISLIKLVLLVGALSATVSSISGFVISSFGAYDESMVTQHQVLGIGLTLYNWILFIGLNILFRCDIRIYRALLVVFMGLLFTTGHLGGSLTHGSDFLTPPPISQWFSPASKEDKVITLESKAFEVTTKIFKKKCLVCHGKNKQKGKLRLDTREGIVQGGEEGKLIASTASTSLLIERLLLPLDDEDHMPPKEKKQLSKDEINFLAWWIEAGASFENALGELSLPDSLHTILNSNERILVNNLIPQVEVNKADEKIIEQLHSLDVVVTPLDQNTNYLSVSFINVLPENADKAAAEIIKLKSQLIWLNLDFQKLTSESWRSIGFLSNLRKLSVRDANLDNELIAELSGLSQLVNLNLVGTEVGFLGLESMGKMSFVEALSLYETSVMPSDFTRIKELFPSAQIDTGNYFVPILASDTTVLTKQ